MPLINTVKPFCDRKSISPYKLWKQTGIAKDTAYSLYRDPKHLPSAKVLERICDVYLCKPEEIITWKAWEEYLEIE